MSMMVKFWGVRGSIACPSQQHLKYGGNTSCVEVMIDDQPAAILDCGTGVHGLGAEFLRRELKHATVLMSHTHWDHIQGFPFFFPAFFPASAVSTRAAL